MRSHSLWLGLSILLVGCGDSAASGAADGDGGGGADIGGASSGGGGDGGNPGGGGSGAAGGTGGAMAGNPHPLYPALDLDTLPGDGGAVSGPYEPPMLPTTTNVVTVAVTGTAARDALESACGTPGTAVEVPSSAGAIGVVNIGNMEDCDITLGEGVVVEFMVVGSLVGPMHAPAHRIRIRGGQLGGLFVIGGSSDIVFDGVAINNGAVPSAVRSSTAIYMPEGPTPGVDIVERFAVVNSFIRMVAVDAGGGNFDGTAYLAGNARNVFFANNNIVTAGNRNSWGFRLSGGDNTLIVDNTARVSFHKLVRMNDAPVDYVYIKNGVWMREATLTSGGMLINDSFTQLSGSTTDRVYVHDPEVHLLPDSGVTFGASFDPAQAGRIWEARNIAWHALGPQVVEDAGLQSLQDSCTDLGGLCDYGVGTHTYNYNPALQLPTDPWRDLPTFADDDPDNLPVLP